MTRRAFLHALALLSCVSDSLASAVRRRGPVPAREPTDEELAWEELTRRIAEDNGAREP